jgi:eukaryotic-like serine/threonine-protein kinase
MIGETPRARELAQDMDERFSLDTQLPLLGLPAIAAQLQLNRRQPELALNTLRAGLPIEFANTTFSSINISCLCPTYIRGQADLAAGQGTAAVGEFQKIIDHSGIVGNCWTGALAHLGIARANALLSTAPLGDQTAVARTRAINAYKDFFTLWKDADPNIPILKQAKAEYAKLQ